MRKDRDAAININTTSAVTNTWNWTSRRRSARITRQKWIHRPSLLSQKRQETDAKECWTPHAHKFYPRPSMWCIRPSKWQVARTCDMRQDRKLARALETKAKQMVGKVMSTTTYGDKTIKCVVETQQEQIKMLAFLSLAISMVSNIYPTLPRCNTGLTAMMILFYRSLKVSSEYVNDTKAPCFHVTDMTFFIRTKSRGNKTRSSIILLYRYTYSPRDWT